MKTLFLPVLLGLIGVHAALGRGDAEALPIHWHSAALNEEISGQLIRPAPATLPTQAARPRPAPLIVYLQNLTMTRWGTEPDESILADFQKQGYLVLALDYAHGAFAINQKLAADVLKLRHDLADSKEKNLLTEEKIDPDHIYILPAGYRLKRDVEFISAGARPLAMDIWYPSEPIQPVPALMEITCDNVNRMGSFSLLFCHDTFVEGAALNGFAAAMIDHPIAPPYKGIDDPLPQALRDTKAAVRTLRYESKELGFSDRIGVMGFSRGGPFAAMLAVTNDRPELEGDGAHQDISSNVQAALIHGNRYDYTDLLPADPMIPRFTKAWGDPKTDGQTWAKHGAAFYLQRNAAPMFLDTSNAESPEYQDGLAKFEKRLGAIGAEHVYQVDLDGRGHRVTTDPATLGKVYQFFEKHLKSR